MMNIAVVIPAYNEEKTITDITQRALENAPFVIVVDDGSTDKTLEQLNLLKETYSGTSSLYILENDVNAGKAATLWKGMQFSEQLGVDAIITLDADGQHCPEDIHRFIEMTNLMPKTIIIGARLADKQAIPAKRYYANKFANFWLSWAAGYHIDDSQSGFRLYPVSLIKKLSPDIRRSKSFVFESEILIKAAQQGYQSTPIKIAAIYNTDARPSHFRGVTDILLITRMVAWSLISRGMYIPGLIKLLTPDSKKKGNAIGLDGIAMFFFSLIILFLSGGLSYLIVYWKTIHTALRAPVTINNSDILLVLGMRLNEDKINPLYQQRLDRAINVLTKFPELEVIILGGLTGDATISEAEAGKHYLQLHGIDAKRIITEHFSRHTLENMKSAAKLISKINAKSPALITNRFHLYRALSLANGFKINAKPCAAEQFFSYTVYNFIRLLAEAFYMHWYYSGKLIAFATNNKHMLDRIR